MRRIGIALLSAALLVGGWARYGSEAQEAVPKEAPVKADENFWPRSA